MISDKQRSDYPFFIRTEDFVDLDQKAGFQILGRLPRAPLRGCSLPFEGPSPTHAYQIPRKRESFLQLL